LECCDAKFGIFGAFKLGVRFKYLCKLESYDHFVASTLP